MPTYLLNFTDEDLMPSFLNHGSASFLIAVKKLGQREGKTLPELMAEWLEKDPIAMLNAISKFLPREARAHAAHDHALKG